MNYFHLFFYFFIILMLFYTLVNYLSRNILVWWMVFVIITLTFIFIYKIQGNFDESLNYFLIQEFLGFLFLTCVLFFLQILILIVKIGISPFHFWIFSVLFGVDNFLLLWFLTFQKLPFLPVLLYLMDYLYITLILFGILVCYFQVISILDLKFIIVISSTESFNWLILGLLIGVWGFTLLFFYYFLNVILLLSQQDLFSKYFNYTLEIILVFINAPLTFTFFVKIFILTLFISIDPLISMFLLIMIALYSAAFLSWFVNFLVRRDKIKKNNYGYFYYLFFVTSLFIFCFRFSKNYYITLIE